MNAGDRKNVNYWTPLNISGSVWKKGEGRMYKGTYRGEEIFVHDDESILQPLNIKKLRRLNHQIAGAPEFAPKIFQPAGINTVRRRKRRKRRDKENVEIIHSTWEALAVREIDEAKERYNRRKRPYVYWNDDNCNCNRNKCRC